MTRCMASYKIDLGYFVGVFYTTGTMTDTSWVCKMQGELVNGGETVMDVKKNIFVIGLNMENRSPEEIAKDAALQIAAITDRLVEKQKAEAKSRSKEGDD